MLSISFSLLRWLYGLMHLYISWVVPNPIFFFCGWCPSLPHPRPSHFCRLFSQEIYFLLLQVLQIVLIEALVLFPHISFLKIFSQQKLLFLLKTVGFAFRHFCSRAELLAAVRSICLAPCVLPYVCSKDFAPGRTSENNWEGCKWQKQQ